MSPRKWFEADGLWRHAESIRDANGALLFEPNGGYSGKVRCTVCGTEGYPNCPWQQPHIQGHAPCPDCGRQLTVKQDGTPRKHHVNHCMKEQLR